MFELCSFIDEKMVNFPFLLSNFTLPKPNIMKLIHNAYCTKKIKFKFRWFHFHELCPFMNWWFCHFCSKTLFCFNQVLWNFYTMLIMAYYSRLKLLHWLLYILFTCEVSVLWSHFYFISTWSNKLSLYWKCVFRYKWMWDIWKQHM